MKPDPIMRRFRPDDANSLVDLWQEVLPSPHAWNQPRSVLHRKLAQSDDLVIVAEQDGAVVGAVIAGYDGIRGWIYNLAVLADHRRCGIGRQLLREAESALTALGCPKVNLQVRPTNSQVVSFYQRCGYVIEDRTSLAKPLPAERTRKDDCSQTSPHRGIDTNPTKDDISFLHARLDEFNAQQTGRDDFKSLNMVIRNEAGTVVAGLKGLTGWNWLYVEILWVKEECRGSGLGTRLLNFAETEAKSRGCIGACLSSFNFQAPSFYEKHGYSQFGQIDDYPPGNTMFFMSKRFSNGPLSQEAS